ncbi:hypothetical protein KAU11_06350 [Candidatus Babeliales bacterium]|nr:hypothetical protein [Candidatus Babeliales bacterium]
MEKSLFTKINWPVNTCMDLLAEVLPEDLLLKLLSLFMGKSEGKRCVRFPKRQTILKCLAHYFGQRVERGELTWKEIMRELKGNYPTLKQLRKETKLNISQKEMKKLCAQRRKEIQNER